MTLDELKDALRAELSAARAGVTEWRDDERAARLLDAAAALPVGTVAAYASRPGEPGTAQLIDGFAAAGWRVLLPVLGREVGWAEFTGWANMAPGWRGIPQPTGPRLEPAALAEADLVVAACLAVGLDGSRLGTGGGWYDRALPHRRPGVPVVVMARDSEVLDTLPMGTHDVRVDGFVTEARIAAPFLG